MLPRRCEILLGQVPYDERLDPAQCYGMPLKARGSYDGANLGERKKFSIRASEGWAFGLKPRCNITSLNALKPLDPSLVQKLYYSSLEVT